jgi:glutamyl-tRNA(Gln) amidotransferase subunit E
LRLKDLDAFVLVAEDERKARLAFDEMRPRATAAIQGVPPETREPRPDGTTAYSRPLPGKARMYPETDVPPIRVTKQRLERIRKGLPERPEVTVSRLLREYGIHEQQARQLVQEGTNDSFELIAREFGEAKLVATVLLYTFPELRREGLAVDALPLDNLRELFALLKAARFAKEAVPDLLREMARRGARASEAIERLGVRGLTREAVEAIVDEILTRSHDLVASRGEDAERAVMGRVMKKVRGRADGKLVSEVVHSRLESRLKGEAKEGKKGEKKKAPQQD